jgi:hypothetical protein
MVADILCALCTPMGEAMRTMLSQFNNGKVIEDQLSHCYGRSGHTTPGLLGGWRCPCECGSWDKP